MSEPDPSMTIYFQGRLAGLLLAATYYEANIKSSFDPHQVATILRAMAAIEVNAHPCRYQEEPDLQACRWGIFG